VTPSETVALTRYVKACCPQQQIDQYTPDAWFDLLGDLSMADCHEAVKVIGKRQPFIAPAEIRAEVRRIRNDRLARHPAPAPPSELADEPGRYKAVAEASVRQIADGMARRMAIAAAPVREDPPPQEFTEARAALGPALPRSKQELARQQAAESRAAREAADKPTGTGPDEGEPAA
jgi:hypothetical protein